MHVHVQEEIVCLSCMTVHGEPNTSASLGHNEIVGRLPALNDAFKKASAQSDLDMEPILAGAAAGLHKLAAIF